MNHSRRRFLQVAAGAAAAPALLRTATAQSYPSRPVRLVVGFPAGGAADISARLLAERLSQRLAQLFVVENRPGAVGNLATEMVVRAAPDGHTLLLVVSANATNPALYDNLKFDILRDIVPIASLSAVPGVMTVHPSLPTQSVTEFVAYAKANPGKINMATGGVGSSSHLFGEMFKMLSNVDLFPVHYRGDDLTGLLGQQVQVMFPLVPTALDNIRAGTLHGLAVTTSARYTELPSLAESIPGYEASVWNGLGAPKGTPETVVQKLNAEVNAALRDNEFSAKLARLGAAGLGGSPSSFGRLIADETEKWAKVIRFAGVKA